jgi:hypothetical protein
MDSSTPPVGQPDPYDRYRVEEIQKDRKETPSQGLQYPQQGKSPLLALVLRILRRLFDLFDPAHPPSKIPSAARVHLLLFRAALETLKKEDRSQDSAFLVRWSEIWRELIEDQKRFPALLPCIEKIDTYPDKHEFSLGYYLSEYTEEKWLPFSFLEMVSALHQEHTMRPLDSTLAKWIQQIDSVLPLLL